MYIGDFMSRGFTVSYFSHPKKGTMALIRLANVRQTVAGRSKKKLRDGRIEILPQHKETVKESNSFPEDLAEKMRAVCGGCRVKSGYRIHPAEIHRAIALMQAMGYELQHPLLLAPETVKVCGV